MKRHQIVLIDSDMRRRARISHDLTNMATFVTPLEDIAELTLCWPDEALILIEDKGSSFTDLRRLMKNNNRTFPVVVLSAHASARRKSELLFAGAKACLPLPCDGDRLKATIESVLARHDRTALARSGPEEYASLNHELSGFPQMAEAQGVEDDSASRAARTEDTRCIAETHELGHHAE